MIPFTAKSEPMDTYEIVNQPFTEDEEMPELPHLPRRTQNFAWSPSTRPGRRKSPSQLAQLPFTIKMEPGLQQDAITSSNSYESPMSSEPASSSEAQASIPVLQIQCVSGGVDLSAYATIVKQEKPGDEGCESDASDATVDLNLSGEQGRQCATDANQQNNNSSGGTTTPTGSESSGAGGATDAAGTSGGQAAGGVCRVKTEKPDCKPQLDATSYDFAELVLDSKRMQYVAYVERNSEALFLCILPGCKFITKIADSLSNHIAKKHSRVLWDGYCQECRSQITPADCPMTEEFQHLLTTHARRKTPPIGDSDGQCGAAGCCSCCIYRSERDSDSRNARRYAVAWGRVESSPLMPILPQPVPVQAFTSPMILQSGATISPAPVALNQLFTPTHTIPAQIRPITATVGPNISVTPVIRAPTTLQAGPQRTVRLKPWTNMVTTKSQEHRREMLEEISLHCLFKCILRKCWLECAYCDLIAPNSADLLVHIDTEHANCGFQCNMCFYRSRDPTNVVVHQKDHHPSSDIPKKILIMPDNLKSFGDAEWRSMQASLRQHVLPLHCTSKYEYQPLIILFDLFELGGGLG
ncbi:hypothetical protein pipiens_008376 [Culex pipiens pipiens]|uniref:C2H2-type domain-containing protein n=1 Tax=Culex pipiens pipiens TaxID=38569 RepID=A0ABD1DHN1_CULPP